MRLRRKVAPGLNKKEFIFPMEVLFAISSTIVVFIVIMNLERAVRFRIFYPIALSIFGVLCPTYIILKNKTMSEIFIKKFYENPRKVLQDFVEKIRTKNDVQHVHEVAANDAVLAA